MTMTIPKGSTGDRTYIANWAIEVFIDLPTISKMLIAKSVTWDLKPGGGVWDWDSNYFSAAFNGAATFTAN